MDVRTMARALGRRGGLSRACRLSADDRRRIAALGGQARSQSLTVARRIADNFRYLAAVRDLQGGSHAIRRVRSSRGPLPGIYPRGPRHGR
jgi:hypothetical protein